MNPVHDIQKKQTPLMSSLAWVLIVAGLIVLVFVLTEVYSAYTNITSNQFISNLTALLNEQSLLRLADGSHFAIEQGAAQIGAIILFIMFASLGGSLGLGLVKAGVHVLSPQFDEQFVRLKQRIDNVANQLKRTG
jgi:hypothetical protein